MQRTEADCIYLASVIAEMTEVQLALLFGLLAGSYIKHPDAIFWDVLQDRRLWIR